MGGFTLGAEKATGNKPKALISYAPFFANDSNIVNHYKNDVPYIVLDDNVEQQLSQFKNIDIVTSTCPCAGLSQLNTSKSGDKARGSDAVQNQWMYKSTEHVLKYIQPKVLIGENAPALFTKSGLATAERLKNIGIENGYSFTLYKTSTSLHGIPQTRTRTFFIFWKAATAPVMQFIETPRLSFKEFLRDANVVTPKDVIERLTADLEKEPSFRYARDRFGPNFRDEILKHGKTVNQYLIKTETMQDYLDYLIANNIDSTKFAAMKTKVEGGGGYWDNSIHIFGDTINAIAGRVITSTIHPEENRWLSMQEYACLMGMPSDFEVLGGEKNLNMVAQNVPTCTAQDMVNQCMKFIRGELVDSGSAFNRQDNTNHKLVEHDIIKFE